MDAQELDVVGIVGVRRLGQAMARTALRAGHRVVPLVIAMACPRFVSAAPANGRGKPGWACYGCAADVASTA